VETILKKSFFTLLFLVIVLGPIAGIKTLQIQVLMASDGGYQPSETVSSATATEQSWKQTLEVVGSLMAVQGVLVSSELSGKIEQIHFKSGQSVKIGQLLLELDASTEKAKLAATQADARLAEINLRRAKKLRETNTVAEAELDTAEANFLAADAQVENLKTVIAKKQITAPFSGQLGIRKVNLGQYINSGDTVVSLQSLDPIFVDFSFPQNWISHAKLEMPLEVKIDAYPEEIFGGHLTAVTPEVEVTTRTLNLRGTLDNPEGKLLPGMFVQVALMLPEKKPQLIIPSTAILYASYGDSVFIINEKDGKQVAEQKFVRLGESRGDFVSIIEGLEVGQTVVATGAFKLQNGTSVMINNSLSITPELDPDPEDS
tara:strand:+ start:3733 stop:4851 length:1119 start_codon:yes stop_codon:yes gene_type:complete